jgi:uncharacterized protein (DUF2126 family)/transglutaminase-like putative cysteine protease
MSLHVALTHTTSYTYDRLIGVSPQIIRLRPAPHCRTPILSYSLGLEPEQHFLNWQQDPFGNFMARMVVPEKTGKLSVTVNLIADMAVINPFDFFIEDSASECPFEYSDETKAELSPYLTPERAGRHLKAYMASLDLHKRPTNDFLTDINRQLQKDIKYLIRMEPGVQTPEETLRSKSGSCRDSAWLLVQIFRQLGLAARFVSGYLIQLRPDVESLDGPSGAATDFCDLHAWAEVYVPGAGWIGLDATSGLLAGEGHIPLAATPHPSSAAPISGAHEQAEVAFQFDMSVTRILETPRVTKPYSDDQWSAILKLGDDVDSRLLKGDVRLSMGGEPTFIALDDTQSDEWNTAAVGPTKRRYAEDLVRRLQTRFAPGALLHYGQGKWYPGEQLPRWAFAIYWRSDKQALWSDLDLIDREVPRRSVTIEDADTFTSTLCETLGLPKASAFPAYEDPAHFALAEQKLPLGVSVEELTLEDEIERARLVRVLERGLGKPASYVLPIQAWQSRDLGRCWITERWSLRRERLYLIPGDSPAGFRLPLGSLPFLDKADFPTVTPRDPLGATHPMADQISLVHQRRQSTSRSSGIPGSIEGFVRTAMTVEPRQGHICVFMPPLNDAEDFAALAGAIELTAKATNLPVHIEGYEPPHDTRLNVIKVTPDPGVIEVNVHPATSWRQAVDITTGLYEDARQGRLATEKFMIDGRHTGTGGGNHIVLGGITPSDSPFLRRPDVLASIIRFWQNHPSLSYLFSGTFIGPTSQAPRVDEGRHESLYELEIALKQIPDPFATGGNQRPVAPWMVDRLLRNLLIDVAGNTHRAEICIDKLYSPDGPAGRLGLVEFRSFEMPPHARMSLAQQLLLRALIVRFWEQPYRQPLVRWGTALHDRFMLPQFLWADFTTVVADLAAANLPVDAEWFKPHHEFRFQKAGHVVIDGIELEVRQALEPWHVLGEEAAAGGTARYVDSSLERMQVKVSGLTGTRYAVTCNGIALPLAPTGTQGEMIAGVRFRAWQPPTCLHPFLPVDAPLVFDIVDTWSNRSLGGCRYHVSHPGGRSHEIAPINSYEAEGRRLARFETTRHTPGNVTVAPATVNPDYPLTLDLRRFH